MIKTYLVTGGAGFIGSNFVLAARGRNGGRIVNLDKLTYAGNPSNLEDLSGDPDHVFIRGDICDGLLLRQIFEKYRPETVVHFAAESHVDRSILEPGAFIQTNVMGTFCLLEEALRYWRGLDNEKQRRFRLLHVSTDEVYGSLEPGERGFSETHAYDPSSPYSASKAGGDHLARAFFKTYGLPTLIVNASNNYGPYQFPEKLIPLVILNALDGKPLPIYGHGDNIRDWLYVEDHCRALELVVQSGCVGETYNIGACCERTNLQVVNRICDLLDRLVPDSPYRPHAGLISFIQDRPGHDLRYAIDAGKITRDLGWKPRESFDSGLEKTIDWYLHHEGWVNSVRTGAYLDWMKRRYESPLGIAADHPGASG